MLGLEYHVEKFLGSYARLIKTKYLAIKDKYIIFFITDLCITPM